MSRHYIHPIRAMFLGIFTTTGLCACGLMPSLSSLLSPPSVTAPPVPSAMPSESPSSSVSITESAETSGRSAFEGTWISKNTLASLTKQYRKEVTLDLTMKIRGSDSSVDATIEMDSSLATVRSTLSKSFPIVFTGSIQGQTIKVTSASYGGKDRPTAAVTGMVFVFDFPHEGTTLTLASNGTLKMAATTFKK